MNTTISNGRLSVTVSDFGAELQSVILDGRGAALAGGSCRVVGTVSHCFSLRRTL